MPLSTQLSILRHAGNIEGFSQSANHARLGMPSRERAHDFVTRLAMGISFWKFATALRPSNCSVNYIIVQRLEGS